jgi:hypothetical protein
MTERITQLAEHYVFDLHCKGYLQVIQELVKGIKPQDRALAYTQLQFEILRIRREQKEKEKK